MKDKIKEQAKIWAEPFKDEYQGAAETSFESGAEFALNHCVHGEYILVHIDELKPPMSIDFTISDPLLVFDKDRRFIGTDRYNIKLERWLISRETAKYWLKKISHGK